MLVKRKSATSTTKRATLHWLRHGATSTTSTRPRHLRRRRTHHGCPCLEDRCKLLCCSSADTQHSTVCQQTGATISRHVTRMLSRLDYRSATLAGIPKYLLDRLQSILNTAARLIYRDHVSPLFRELHWLSVPERIKYRLAVLVFRCRYDMALEYMARDLQWAADTDSRQRLRSSSSQQLIVPRTRLFTVGDRTFGAAAARIWNSLPPTVTSATLNSFRNI